MSHQKKNQNQIPTFGATGQRVGDRIGPYDSTDSYTFSTNTNDADASTLPGYYKTDEGSYWPFFITPIFWTKTAGYGVRLFFAELLAQIIYLIPVYITQAYINFKYGLTTPTPLPVSSEDYTLLATVRAFSFIVPAFTFSRLVNTGVHLNCALSFAFSLMGLDSWLSTVIRWFSQFGGSSLAWVLIYGFSNVDPTLFPTGTDAGVGVAIANSGGHNAAYFFLWELLIATVYFIVVQMLFSTQRIYDDTYEGENEGSRPGENGLKGLPAEYHRYRYFPVVFQNVIVIGLLIWLGSCAGNIATQGNGVVGNFFFAFPRYFNTEKISGWDSLNPIASQGASNFFTPFLAAIISTVVVALFNYLNKFVASTPERGVEGNTPPYFY